MIYLFTIVVLAANYWLIFCAPKMKMPREVNFILINPPKPKEPEKEEKLPWWAYPVIFSAIILGQTFPVIGFFELFLLGVLMWWVWMIEIKLADKIADWVLWWIFRPVISLKHRANVSKDHRRS